MKMKAAGKYFAYVGKHFPVMCASGAFEFLPPVNEAARWLDRFDDLSQSGLAKHATRLRKFQKEFDIARSGATTDLERATARALTISAGWAASVLDLVRPWERAPEFFLQVAFTGLEQAVTLPSKDTAAREKRFVKRLRGIPALLDLAPQSIEAVSPTSRGTAQTMIRDCARFLSGLERDDLGKMGKAPRYLAEALHALREYDRFVASCPEVPELGGPPFDRMVSEMVGADRHAGDIFTVAETEYHHRLDALRQLETSLGQPWQDALAEYNGPAEPDISALDAVVREMHRLRSFIFQNAMPGVFQDSGLRVDSLPVHLASTLRPIHYDPALGAWPGEQSHCHVSAQLFTGRGFRDDEARLRRMRREYIFMTARQTYPGRHLLDSQRRALEDTPMAQITNPLFMAGWLAMAEDMLEELGYLTSDLDRLVHHHRGLCRAALAMIDAGLAKGDLDQDRCLTILEDAGYSREEALDRVRSIRLNPASRVMPILGLAEMNGLRKTSGMDTAEFCQRLFAAGQLPPDDMTGILS
ncbi:DUF885 family protein [Pseudodesulfovibrio sp.]|uniref:DUF885 family protein n=1 Tax=unclassified Pseudodesulfovibrio TaxID=2661612 RepID=UPI003B0012B2